jgi:hypothetical protein
MIVRMIAESALRRKRKPLRYFHFSAVEENADLRRDFRRSTIVPAEIAAALRESLRLL